MSASDTVEKCPNDEATSGKRKQWEEMLEVARYSFTSALDTDKAVIRDIQREGISRKSRVITHS